MKTTKNLWAQVVAVTALVLGISVWATVAPSAQAPAPSGTGIWAGVYTDAQSVRGEGVANKSCTACHGTGLAGGEAGPTLVGLEFLSNWNTLTVADLYERINTTMPADSPGSLTPQQTADLVSYVLKLNKYPAGQTELATDMAALKAFTIEPAK
jgi:mono/diheme cytochrome c family protein